MSEPTTFANPSDVQKRASVASEKRLLDAKPYVEHHPTFGYRYIAGIKLDLPRPGGGRYQIQVNADGIRSDRDYDFKKPPGVRRIIVLGDSMPAGQYITNAHRFSELMERSVPGLEVINLALEGSGTDQQVLLYEHVGLKYEHDMVLLLPFLQNVRRNMVEAREGVDPRTGKTALRPKPRFELVEGGLVLRNVPVPKEALAVETRGDAATDSRRSISAKLKTVLSALPGAGVVKKIVYGIKPWEPFPEYRDPQSAEWRLMAALIHRLKELAGARPVVVAPTFYANYARFSMARNYWHRYASLEDSAGVHAIDLLPHFRAVGDEAVRCFQEPHDMHFSAYGNIVLADALQDELSRRRLLTS